MARPARISLRGVAGQSWPCQQPARVPLLGARHGPGRRRAGGPWQLPLLSLCSGSSPAWQGTSAPRQSGSEQQLGGDPRQPQVV